MTTLSSIYFRWLALDHQCLQSGASWSCFWCPYVLASDRLCFFLITVFCDNMRFTVSFTDEVKEHYADRIYACNLKFEVVSEFRVTKTRLYNFDPLKPHFYIVKLGFIEVYIIFLISAQKHRSWVLVRTASSRRF